MSQFLKNKVKWLQHAIRAYSETLDDKCHKEEDDYIHDGDTDLAQSPDCIFCRLAFNLRWVANMLEYGKCPKERLENSIAVIDELSIVNSKHIVGVKGDYGRLVICFKELMEGAIALAEKEDAERAAAAPTN
ncbi:hypothetical protein HK104_000131 [Borealophlyctis nickersoniae]|nr:hypothetical protein HK104_000131 [Borealophlyctis nickersoniae]